MIHPPPDFALLSGSGRTMAVYFFSSSPGVFALDRGSVRVTLTPVRGGATVVLVPAQTGIAQSSPQNDKTGPRYGQQQIEVDFPLPATAGTSMYSVRVQTPDGVPQTYPSYAYVPSFSNGDTAVVRMSYVGKAAYALGDAPVHCMYVQQAGVQVDFSVSPLSEVRVVAVDRSEGAAPIFSIAGPSRFRETSTAYLAIEPLIITFGASIAPKDIAGVGVSTRGPSAGSDGLNDALAMQRHPESCRTLTAAFSGSWDVQRSLSLANPAAHWTTNIVKAVRKAAIATNWSRAMVAAAVGYPSVYGSVEEMNQLDVWQYDAPAPNSFTVTFQNGRVVNYSPPGMLP